MNEGTLKAKWVRHIRKQGFEVKALSPTSVPGLPDLVVIDKSETKEIRGWHRARVHWVEAKVYKDRPDCFTARREATAKQTDFITTWNLIGAPTWWLILAPKKWLLVDGQTLSVKRTKFNRSARSYGDAVKDLHAPETQRYVQSAALDVVLNANRLRIAEMYD